MTQYKTLGPPQRALHKLLLSVRAFDRLSTEEQDALAAVPKRDRTGLYDQWSPENTEFVSDNNGFLVPKPYDNPAERPEIEELHDCPMFLLEQAFHSGPLPVNLICPFWEDRAEMIVQYSAVQKVKIKGFDRFGNIPFGLTISNPRSDAPEVAIAADQFTVKKVHDTVEKLLGEKL